MATSEPEFIHPIEQLLHEKGVRLLTGKKVDSFEQRSGNEIVVHLGQHESVGADFVESCLLHQLLP